MKCAASTSKGYPCQNMCNEKSATCHVHQKNKRSDESLAKKQEKIIKFLVAASEKLLAIAEMRHRFCTELKDIPQSVRHEMTQQEQLMEDLLYDPVKGLQALMASHNEDIEDDFRKLQTRFMSVTTNLLSSIVRYCKGRNTAPYVVQSYPPTREQVVQVLKRGDKDSLRYVKFMMTFTWKALVWSFGGVVQSVAVMGWIYQNMVLVLVMTVVLILQYPSTMRLIIPGLNEFYTVIEAMLAFAQTNQELKDLKKQVKKLMSIIADILKVRPEDLVRRLTDRIMKNSWKSIAKRKEELLLLGGKMWSKAEKEPTLKLGAPASTEPFYQGHNMNVTYLHMTDQNVSQMNRLALEGVCEYRGSGNPDVMPVFTVVSLAVLMLKRVFRF
jgi:hypothetical protein